MECPHRDCFTCPYYDCIYDLTEKIGRVKLSPEEIKRRKIKYRKEYSAQHKKEISEKGFAERDKRVLKFVVVNDGYRNKQIKPSELSQYQAEGWTRGRI